MAGVDITEQVAALHKRFLDKKIAVIENFSLFKARSLETDSPLRELLTKLRLEWREKHAPDSLRTPG